MVIIMHFRQRERGSIVIFEYVSGGGPGSFQKDLVLEGFSMVSVLFSAFSALDGLFPSLILRKDITLSSDKGGGTIIPVNPGEGEELFISECRRSEYAVLIAPETDGISERISGLLPETGVKLLGPDTGAVELASNKALLMFALGRSGIPVPRWCVAREVRAMLAAAEEIGYPVAGKPLQGTSCEGSILFKGSSDIEYYFTCKDNERLVLLLQSLVQGEAMSLSMVVGRSGKARLLSVNIQNISISTAKGINSTGLQRFIYNGGVSGIEEARFSKGGSWRWSDMESLAQKVVSSIPGLMGFAGIDFVMTDKGPVVIEVNPRLTTPLAVAGAQASWNMGKVLFDACVEGSLPNKVAVPSISFRKNGPIDGSL
jgi:predicted ATP-grasp superfamily ATP-dependent carboligase